MRQLAFLLILSSVCVFTLSEVVDNNFNTCKQFFLNNIPPDFTPPAGVSVKPICQCLRDENNLPHYFYATLYSTTWKIPVYSAYVYHQRKSVGRCDRWYIEPQLDGYPEKCMRSSKDYSKNIGTNQAVNSDYEKSVFDRGHLYPVFHTNSELSMLATSTLTNAAPQDPDFNRNTWWEHEKAVVKDLESCDKAYVVTGVVPNTTDTINNRVTVSKYYWRATCCLKNNQYTGKGYWGPDNNGKVQNLTIVDLQEELRNMYGLQRSISIFPGQNYQPPHKKPRT